MAVYTPISFPEASTWFHETYNLGELVGLRGISGGIENTNYFLDASLHQQTHQYVLTIFERLNAQQLPFYVNLMAHLATHDIKVPSPFPNRKGEFLQVLAHKPAIIVSKLKGDFRLNPQVAHCAQVGSMLAKMHLVGHSYTSTQANLRSLPWWQSAAQEVANFIDQEKKKLLESELLAQRHFFNSVPFSELPDGACHCDLFRDNVLFNDDDILSGFFDFYFAGTDKLLFDIAVTANDWCIELSSGVFDPARLQSFLQAYQQIRPFTAAEQACWSMMLRAAALRFWISRLWDFYIPRNAQLLTPHDPSHFETILRLRIQDYAN